MSDKPGKGDLPNELRRILNTLTDDAQSVGLRKYVEAGFDVGKGKLSLQETFINLSHARDILADAVETGAFSQLPLKIQYVLFDQVQAVERELDALAKGTDALINVEAAVEDLNASVWQFQLHNLSGEVLGFQTKMNQLKSQEVKIREVARRADAFEALYSRTELQAGEIADRAKASDTELGTVKTVIEQLQALLRDSTELSQKVSALAAQVEQHDTAVGQQLATAKVASADTEAIAAKSKEMRTEIEAARSSLEELTAKAHTLLTHTETTGTAQLAEFETKYDAARRASETATATLSAKLDASIGDLTTQTSTKLDALTASADTRVNQVVNDASSQFAKNESTREVAFDGKVKEFVGQGEVSISTFVASSAETVRKGNEERLTLIDNLNELEGRIKTVIEKATGFSLFHAFQERQREIVKSKNFWAKALAGCVAISLGVSGLFIYHYWTLAQVDAAFFLKLSITIPMIYAIAFCNLQYSRERKLEEEYAFKSSVSISLDPYQKLVFSLIDQNNKDEMAKYTQFVIHSVNRVFTSPTDPLFRSSRRDRTYAEKLIKAAGAAIGSATDPLIKGLLKK